MPKKTNVRKHPRQTKSGRTNVKRHERKIKTRGELQDEWRELNRIQDRKYQLYRSAVNTYDPKLTVKQSADRIAKRQKAWENSKLKSAKKLAETETAPIK